MSLAMQLDRKVKSEIGGVPVDVQPRKKSQRMREAIHHKVWMLMQYISGNCDLWLVSTVAVLVVFNSEVGVHFKHTVPTV